MVFWLRLHPPVLIVVANILRVTDLEPDQLGIIFRGLLGSTLTMTDRRFTTTFLTHGAAATLGLAMGVGVGFLAFGLKGSNNLESEVKTKNKAETSIDTENQNKQKTDVSQTVILSPDNVEIAFRVIENLQLNESISHANLHTWMAACTVILIYVGITWGLYLAVMREMNMKRKKMASITEDNLNLVAGEISNVLWNPVIVDEMATKFSLKYQVIQEQAEYAKVQKQRLLQETLKRKEQDQNQRMELLETIRQQSKVIRSLKGASRQTTSTISDEFIEDLTLSLNLGEK